MATGGDAFQATREAARLTISTVVEGIATGIVDIGAAMPVVAPLCIALRKAKDIVDGVSRNKEDLAELLKWCQLITEQVVDKAKAPNIQSTIDVSPIQQCVDDLNKAAKRYRDQGRFARRVQFRRDGDDIRKLRARIQAVIPIMGLAGVVDLVALLQSRPKLALVPKKAPDTTRSFHVVRDGVVDRACKILGDGGGPAVAALTGRSGAGKTTSAAAMVGERGPIRPRPGETEDQAHRRLDRVRALFPDGVVWLRVGNGAGAPDHLPPLMLKLAKRLREDVMKGVVDAPEVGEDGGSYVKKIVSQEKLKCLVVADDVWEASVVQKLRETGMWVLLTTRFPEMVEPNERVVMDTLTEAEAEDVLRGAADLPPAENLCDAAKDVLKICSHVAMDIAFVGSWTSVRAANGETKSREAWGRAVEEIESHGGGVGVERDANRLAVLHAGFKYIGREDPLAQELYAELAVFPDGHAFGKSDAGVLLGDEEVATIPISILERWGVLKADASETYRMHDTHVDFARGELMGWDKIRKSAVGRWTHYVSRLDVAIGFDLYALLRMWRALENAGGDGWWTARPYDDQLVEMDILDQSKTFAVNFVAELYEHDQKFNELETLMQRILKHGDNRSGDRPEVQMIALHHTMQSLIWQGRFREWDDLELERRRGKMVGPSFQLQEPDCGTVFAQASTAFHVRGICAVAARRFKDAEEWFRKALKFAEDGGCSASSQAVSTLHAMGRCVWAAGRPREAELLFKRALEIKEVKLGADHPHVAWTLQNMGECVRQAGRLTEAEALFKRTLEIQEAKQGADDLKVACTLDQLGLCTRQMGRLKEAEVSFRRALELKEAKLGPDNPKVAWTLRELGLCVREVGRAGEAEALFKRALEIYQANLGAVHVDVASTLNKMGWCAREAGWSGEAGELLKRALEIQEAKLGADHVDIVSTLWEMGWCVRETGRPGEAEGLFRRALKIGQAKLGADHVDVASTLVGMGVCVFEAGRSVEAIALFRRALAMQEAKLGANHVYVASTLCLIGWCMWKVGRPGEAIELYRRALETYEATLGGDDLRVTGTRYWLRLCVEEDGRPAETE